MDGYADLGLEPEDQPLQVTGAVCGLGSAERPCFDRDGNSALDDDLSCAFCGHRPTLVWTTNLPRGDTRWLRDTDPSLLVGAPRADDPDTAAALYRDGVVGLYFVF